MKKHHDKSTFYLEHHLRKAVFRGQVMFITSSLE